MNSESTSQELLPEHAPNDTFAPSGINVVGIGASAGGIRALQGFFAHAPADCGMAFVVILHLSPSAESNVAEILQQTTAMPVTQVTEATRVEPNHVYVIPPNKLLSIQDGTIYLQAPAGEQVRRAPIDLFFRSLADSHGRNAAAVVLSGSGADGTVGVQRIKENGGAVLAQDPHEAEFDAMPRNVIATGLVDYILPVADIPAALIEYWRTAEAVQLPIDTVPLPASDDDALRIIFTVLRSRTGHDFSQYKRPTLLRRIGRRMQVNNVTNLAAYLQVLRSRPEEVQALLRDLLISVTNFFRDADAWLSLTAVIPNLFASKDAGDQVRVWVPACATGEEAYTVAMLLYEHASTLDSAPTIQVFATDIDEDAINTARQGMYPETIVADVSAERLQRFFMPEPGRYRIKKEIRDLVLFAPHNLVRDPPFSRLDLITCRNLLIYLNRGVQAQVLQLFHFMLLPNGYLLLGASESADSVAGLFTPIDKGARLFQRRTAPMSSLVTMPTLPLVKSARAVAPRQHHGAEDPAQAFADLDLHVLARYGPPRVIVNENDDIVHLAKGVGRFLTLADGELTHNLIKMVHPDLRLELRTALFTAMQRQESTETRWQRVEIDGTPRLVHIRVQPIQEPEWASGSMLVLFDDMADTGDVLRDPTAHTEPMLQQLQEELLRTKEQLRTTTDQYETAVEEYKAANEELQAINEELRATTEELETSKEELQSANEELITVNQELKHKVEEVSQSNNDLQNLMASTQIATIFIDRELRIRRYTPSTEAIFNLIPTDINRPLAHITHKIDYAHMSDDVAGVLRTLSRTEREIQSQDGHSYLARLLPYRTANDSIEGVVLTFVDITERKQAEEVVRESEEQFRRAIEDAPIPIIMHAEDGQVLQISKSWTELTGYRQEDIPTFEAWLNQAYGFGADEVRQRMHSLFKNPTYTEDMEFDIVTRTGKHRTWLFHASSPGMLRDGRRFVVGMALDITERKRAEEAVQRARDELNARVQERTAELRQANTQLQELVRKLVTAQEDERRRIARELHDQLGQQISALQLNLAALEIAAQSDTALQARVEQAQQIAAMLDHDVDQLAYELRPSGLDDFGLHVALQQHVETWSQRHGIAAEVQIVDNHQRALPAEIESVLYRVVQEALTNVAKHADAQHVSVILEQRSNEARVIVEDDGKGFDPGAPLVGSTSHRLGLSGMRERVELVGGSVTVESEPGRGTTIYVRIPLSGGEEGRHGTQTENSAR
jgi:two-component system CheB/CheR fusion protein